GMGNIAVDPNDRNTIYLATGSIEENGTVDRAIINGYGYGAGLLKTVDGGQNWTQEFIYSATPAAALFPILENALPLLFPVLKKHIS
ncbi:MAG: hypothetical protein EBZ77_15420, partial [Chitinophagia bacterium]|nr:hypothetical protein [Chitinophagia bacterium]